MRDLAPVPAMPFGSPSAGEALEGAEVYAKLLGSDRDMSRVPGSGVGSEDPHGGDSGWRRFTPRFIDESLCMARTGVMVWVASVCRNRVPGQICASFISSRIVQVNWVMAE